MRRQWFVLVPISLAAVFLDPSAVLAERVWVFTYGDTIRHVADIPAPIRKGKFAQILDKIKPAVGFRYSSFGIVYLDFWTWGGKHCLYVGKTSWDKPLPEIAKLVGKSEEEFSNPWYYRFPPGLLVLAGIVGLAVLVSMFRKSPARRVKELLEDPRYQKALDILADESKKLDDADAARMNAQTEGEAQIAAMIPAEAPTQESDKPYAATLTYLMGEGISAKEAEKNLNLILTIHATHARGI